MKERNARIIAFYLPQYHPVIENDKYWGKGFTEWRNVAKSVPLFRGHNQPRIPADLGFYDLRLPQVRAEQAKLAEQAGIEGFCYWHYWFGGGKEVLQMPLDEVVKTGAPEFPFCIGWALHDWTTKTWENGKNKSKDQVIFRQSFLGEGDDTNHFYRLLKAFQDERYIKVDGKLLFLIYNPEVMPHVDKFMDLWNRLAEQNNLPGFFFVGHISALPEINSSNIRDLEETVKRRVEKIKNLGFDAVEIVNNKYAEIKALGIIRKVVFAAARRIVPGLMLDKYDYKRIAENYYSKMDYQEDVFPQLLCGWDRSPRAGRKAIIYYNDTPDNFRIAIRGALRCVKNKSKEHRVIFLNSWNEWGEGAYMEPDLLYGNGKLVALKEELTNFNMELQENHD